MSTDESFDEHDPFFAHFHREPLPDAGVRIILITELPEESARLIVASVEEAMAAAGRPVETRVIAYEQGKTRLGQAMGTALEGRVPPLALVTTAIGPLSPAHLEPLFAAIDLSDHVTGRRPLGPAGRFVRWLGSLPRKVIFAIPILDIHSPCQLHRSEKLAAIAFQSASSFLDVEVMAKATFLGHLLNEVDMPPIHGRVFRGGWLADLNEILKHPVFLRHAVAGSCPLEEPQREHEGGDSPGREDRDGLQDIIMEQAGSLEQDQAKRADELGQREGLDQGLDARGEAFGREKDPREQVHRQHDHVHESADRLGGAGPAGDQQTDAREGERAQHVNEYEEQEVAADRHAEG
jgi:hypothetical protein